jgi:hypothetical protein
MKIVLPLHILKKLLQICEVKVKDKDHSPPLDGNTSYIFRLSAFVAMFYT